MTASTTSIDLLGAEARPFIAGRFVDGEGETIRSREPGTGRQLMEVQAAAAADAHVAVSSAAEAFPAWRALSGASRAEFMVRLAGQLRAIAKDLSVLEARDAGKPLAEARIDVLGAAMTLEYFAGWANRVFGDLLPGGDQTLDYVRRQPLGPCALIVPWNFPLLIACWKVGPALATGNTVVVKPASATPLSALVLAGAAAKVGLPAGVLNVVPGPGAEVGMALVRHPDTAKVSFTGELQTGRTVMSAAAAAGPKPVTLELGGKSPALIFDDADFVPAVNGTLSGVYGHAGQKCAARTRAFVHRSLYEAFLERAATIAKSLRVGDPLDHEAQMGPVISDEAADRIVGYVENGLSRGGRAVAGGHRLERAGSYVEPTLLADVPLDAPVASEEVFGPVLTVHPFDDEELAVRQANNTEFGLAATIWTRDVRRAHRVAAALDAGTVSVNTPAVVSVEAPFGGFKLSGFGRDLGRDSLDGYQQTKHVVLDLTEGVFDAYGI